MAMYRIGLNRPRRFPFGSIQMRLPVLLTFFQIMPLAMLVSVAIFAVTRGKLDIEDTFPELLKVPVLGWILGGSSTTRKTEK